MYKLALPLFGYWNNMQLFATSSTGAYVAGAENAFFKRVTCYLELNDYITL